MGPPAKPTRAEKNAVTRDWNREFPSLGVYKPMWLLRRAGPLLQGICLDRDSWGDIYKPTFHVHCLGIPSSVVYLTLATQVRTPRSGGHTMVQFRFHQQEYMKIVGYLAEQLPLPLDGDLRVEDVLGAYLAYMRENRAVSSPKFHLDMGVLHAWCGRTGDALSCVDTYKAEATDRAFEHFHEGFEGDPEAFFRKLFEDRDLLQSVVEEQVAAHRADKLPEFRLICGG